MNTRLTAFVAPVLHGIARTAKLPLAMFCLAGLMILPLESQELIKNGNFDAPTPTPSTVIPSWTTFVQGGSFAGDSFYVVSGTAAPPGTGNGTIGPKSAPNYAGSFQAGQGSVELLQTFTVPPILGKVTLSFDMFVNDWNNGPVCINLDWTVPNNECARVDLLTASAAPLSTAPADVIRNFYAGADPTNSTIHPYIHYSFDITPNVTPGGTYQIRFAAVTNVFFLNQGVDNVSITFDPGDAYQVSYAANLGAGQSVVNITNAGTNGGRDKTDFICANVYVFSEDQQLISCCTCPLSPNDLRTLSVQNDLINNTLTPGVPTGVTVALLANDDTGPGACNAATVDPTKLVSGMRAWGTKLHAAPGGGFAVTETPFLKAGLGVSEFQKMTSFCSFIQAVGSKFGICNSCAQGAQGAKKQ